MKAEIEEFRLKKRGNTRKWDTVGEGDIFYFLLFEKLRTKEKKSSEWQIHSI